MKVGGNMNLDVRGNILETVECNKTSNTTGSVIHRGSKNRLKSIKPPEKSALRK
jgi:hypothetical protein